MQSPVQSPMQTTLRTDRLLLRPWRDDDLDAFFRLSRDPAVMEFLLPLADRAASDAAVARLRDHGERHGFCFWALELPGVSPFIGFAGLMQVAYEAHFTPAVEIGWRLGSAFWGRGYATEAAGRALAHGFEDLGLEETVALTVPANRRSRAVMERLGMSRSERDDFDHPRVPEGHPLKRHVLYRLRRQDWATRPAAGGGRTPPSARSAEAGR